MPPFGVGTHASSLGAVLAGSFYWFWSSGDANHDGVSNINEYMQDIDRNHDGHVSGSEATFAAALPSSVLITSFIVAVIVLRLYGAGRLAQKAFGAYRRIEALATNTAYPKDISEPMQEYAELELTRNTRRTTRRHSTKSTRGCTTSAELRDLLELTESLEAIDSSPSLRGFINDFKDWNFDMFDLAQKCSDPLTVVGFSCLETFTGIDIDKAKLVTFLTAVSASYKDVVYHNHLHGAAVARSAFSMCTDLGLGNRLPEALQFAMVFAGLIHDVGHPGVTAPFLARSGDELALTYSEDSPLERMHLATAFRLLRKEANSFLTKDMLAEVRHPITRAVLGTDMARHGEQMQRLSVLIDNLQNGGYTDAIPWFWPAKPPPSYSTPEKKKMWELANMEEFVCEVFLHAADIASPAMHFDQFKRWNQLVTEEFHAQGDRELAEFGSFISVQDGYDRSVSATRLHNFHVGFIKFLVKPLYEKIDALSKTGDADNPAGCVDISVCLENIEANARIMDENVPVEGAETKEKPS
eukprot:TRINITY_DN72716_c0_g1_i1.p1 TRINITY_DN72716_c0_g1~~TRINITY_DN72716_c0_g1_i1.p1  ORF type:complete len:526 (+),score=94.52 TRINITY_DN72716_c0_g1_i1:35-1612(+)